MATKIAGALLDQMIHQRRLGRLDVLVRHAGRFPLPTSPRADGAAGIGKGSGGEGSGGAATAAGGSPAAGEASSGVASQTTAAVDEELAALLEILRERIKPGDAARGIVDFLDLLFQVGHLRLAHRFLELALEFRGHAADFSRPLPDRAQDSREFLRSNHNQRNRADEDKLAPSDIEHANSEGGSSAPALPEYREGRRPACGAAFRWPCGSQSAARLFAPTGGRSS